MHNYKWWNWLLFSVWMLKVKCVFCIGSTIIYAQCHIDWIFIFCFVLFFLLFLVNTDKMTTYCIHFLSLFYILACTHLPTNFLSVCLSVFSFFFRGFFQYSTAVLYIYYKHECVYVDITCTYLFHVGMDSLERGILCWFLFF